MNSLTDLNNYGNSAIDYLDERPSSVTFDNTFTNKDIEVNEGQFHLLPVSANVTEIINYQTANVRYVINISGIPGGSITWPTLPSGCTVTQPVPGTYQLSGIKSHLDWEIVKQPQIRQTPTYLGTYSYTVSIYTDVVGTNTYTVNATVIESDVLSTPEDFVYTSGTTQAFNIISVLDEDPTPVWNFSATPELLDSIADISSSGSGGTFTFNPSTKLLTIVGTGAQINSHLSTLTLTTVNNVEWDYTMTFFIIDPVTEEQDTKTILIKSTDISQLGLVRSNGSFIANTPSAITGGPLVSSNESGYYSLQVRSLPQSAISLLETPSSVVQMKYGDLTGTNKNMGKSVVISKDGLVGAFSAGISGTDGFVTISTNESNTWTHQQTLTSANAWFGHSTLLLDNGNELLVSSPATGYGQVSVYIRSGNTWTYSYAITPYDGGTDDAFFGWSMDVSDDETTLVIGESYEDTFPTANNGAVYVYIKVGGSWAPLQKLLAPTPTAGKLFGDIVAISPDTNYIVIGDQNDSGAGLGRGRIYTKSEVGLYAFTQQLSVDYSISEFSEYSPRSFCFTDNSTLLFYRDETVKIFSRSGTTWSFDGTISAPAGFSAYSAFGKAIKVSPAGNLLVVGAPYNNNRGSVVVYTGSGKNWTQRAILNPSDSTTYEFFGRAVSVSALGETVIVGAPGYNSVVGGFTYNDVGRGYYISRSTLTSTWNSTSKYLTITGLKNDVNLAIDNITLTSSYGNDMTLIYTVTNPTSGITLSRNQDVIRGV